MVLYVDEMSDRVQDMGKLIPLQNDVVFDNFAGICEWFVQPAEHTQLPPNEFVW